MPAGQSIVKLCEIVVDQEDNDVEQKWLKGP